MFGGWKNFLNGHSNKHAKAVRKVIQNLNGPPEVMKKLSEILEAVGLQPARCRNCNKEQTMTEYHDLGWANDWDGYNTADTPQEVKNCIAANHDRSDIDKGPPHRGMDHVVTCDICRIIWHYDSSD